MPSRLRRARALGLGVLALIAGGMPAAQAQTAASDAATIAELRRQLDDMRKRLEQLETRAARRPPAIAAAPAPARAAPPAEARAVQDAAREARAAADQARAAQREAEQARQAAYAVTAPVQGLDAPEPMGRQDFVGEGGDALRADLPGIAFRVPGADTQNSALRLRQAHRLHRCQWPQPDRCTGARADPADRQRGRPAGWRDSAWAPGSAASASTPAR
ncbi:hypothetical protein [Dankookia sp. P2]|uniref:hypothetical protein n=1 Tax=Dankookia sp. P2 TaxID=3423955 RepID=UPI003D66F35F